MLRSTTEEEFEAVAQSLCIMGATKSAKKQTSDANSIYRGSDSRTGQLDIIMLLFVNS